MLRLLNIAFISSLVSPTLTIIMLLMTNAGWLKSEIVVPILFWLMPLLAIASMVISILTLRKYKSQENDTTIANIRKKATLILLQSAFFLCILVAFMGLLINAIKHFQ
jgi:hypothetical protein